MFIRNVLLSVLFPEDGGSTRIRIVGKHIPGYKASYYTRQYFLYLESVYGQVILEYLDSMDGIIKYEDMKCSHTKLLMTVESE
jgi:hypothetical protein